MSGTIKTSKIHEHLGDYFTVEDKRPERSYFVVTCKECQNRWTLGIREGGKVHAGNVLALLDHYAGEHAPTPVRGTRIAPTSPQTSFAKKGG